MPHRGNSKGGRGRRNDGNPVEPNREHRRFLDLVSAHREAANQLARVARDQEQLAKKHARLTDEVQELIVRQEKLAQQQAKKLNEMEKLSEARAALEEEHQTILLNSTLPQGEDQPSWTPMNLDLSAYVWSLTGHSPLVIRRVCRTWLETIDEAWTHQYVGVYKCSWGSFRD